MARSEAYKEKGDFGKALADADEAIRLTPKDVADFNQHAKAHALIGAYKRAAREFDDVTRRFSSDEYALNSSAWLLATSPDDEVRNGQKAVAQATKACELAKWKNSDFISTIAAAYAEVGDFERATSYAKQALSMNDVTPKGRREIQKYLILYEQRKPYRQEPIRPQKSEN